MCASTNRNVRYSHFTILPQFHVTTASSVRAGTKALIYALFSRSGGGGSIGVFRDLTIVRGSNLWICEEYYHNGRYLDITEGTQCERTPAALSQLATLVSAETT